jgi:hypothetical protein
VAVAQIITKSGRTLTILAVAFSFSGCTVVTVAGGVLGAGIAVASTAVDAGVAVGSVAVSATTGVVKAVVPGE